MSRAGVADMHLSTTHSARLDLRTHPVKVQYQEGQLSHAFPNVGAGRFWRSICPRCDDGAFERQVKWRTHLKLDGRSQTTVHEAQSLRTAYSIVTQPSTIMTPLARIASSALAASEVRDPPQKVQFATSTITYISTSPPFFFRSRCLQITMSTSG
jgi:hypothetical protein